MKQSTAFRSLAFAASLAVIAACGSDRDQQHAPESVVAPADPSGIPAAGPARVVLQLGDDLAPAVRERVTTYLTKLTKVTVAAPDEVLDALDAGASIVAIGETWTSRALVPDADAASLAPEGFVLKSGEVGIAHVHALVARGSAKTPTKTTTQGAGRIATSFAAYAALEELGFGFLHPLAPTAPASLSPIAPDTSRREEPRWPLRGLQLHTMHPLELTDMLEKGFRDVDHPASPCYLNVLAMTEVGLGEGALNGATGLLRTVLDNPATGGDAAECLSAPSAAPSFPQLGLRTRP